MLISMTSASSHVLFFSFRKGSRQNDSATSSFFVLRRGTPDSDNASGGGVYHIRIFRRSFYLRDCVRDWLFVGTNEPDCNSAPYPGKQHGSVRWCVWRGAGHWRVCERHRDLRHSENVRFVV